MFRLLLLVALFHIFMIKLSESVNHTSNNVPMLMDMKQREPLKYLSLKRSLLNDYLKRPKRQSSDVKERLKENSVKNYEDIQEDNVSKHSATLKDNESNHNKKIETFDEIKQLLNALTKRMGEFEVEYKAKIRTRTPDIHMNAKTVKKRQRKVKRQHKWGTWTAWSACSVTCGKGREIRWRHCVESCDDVETEMEEKACQLPACGPGKLFGFF